MCWIESQAAMYIGKGLLFCCLCGWQRYSWIKNLIPESAFSQTLQNSKQALDTSSKKKQSKPTTVRLQFPVYTWGNDFECVLLLCSTYIFWAKSAIKNVHTMRRNLDPAPSIPLRILRVMTRFFKFFLLIGPAAAEKNGFLWSSTGTAPGGAMSDWMCNIICYASFLSA